MWQLLKTEELCSLLKREIENFEIWGRRIIEEELVQCMVSLGINLISFFRGNAISMP